VDDHRHRSPERRRAGHRRLAAALCAVALLAGCGGHARPRLVVGAVEDAGKSGDAAAKMRLARDAGIRAVVLSSVWTPPLRRPAPAELSALRGAVQAAAGAGIRPIVAVYSFSGVTPLTPAARGGFAAYAASIPRLLPQVRDVIVGNEPNLNLFWMPQFGPDGSDAAAAAYERLLAESYDAVKRVSQNVNVIGCGLSFRGSDDPKAKRQTHSPTAFLRDLGAAYRASGRTRPLMDMFSIHPYPENSEIPPTFAHPRSTTIGIADYRKLVRLLGAAFDGTAQAGSRLPIVYGEYGVQTQVPRREQSAYTGYEQPAVKAVSPATQARDYVEAIRLAACQPTVRMLLFFHVFDEFRLQRLQTGLYWADGRPKPSARAVAHASLECRR
jgi:hypothetical protein